MPKRKWQEAEKKLVTLEVLKGLKSVPEVAKDKGMSEALVYRWRDQALKAISHCFSENGRSHNGHFTQERDSLLKIIGEQACVIETLKKISEIS